MARPARVTAWLAVFSVRSATCIDFRARNAGAARKGAQAGQQFLEVEGLHQVIVGAGIEAGHAVVHGIARGQHQDGRAESRGAQFAADRVPVLQGQHDVQDHQVVVVDGGLVERAFAIAGDIHRVGLFAQALGDESGNTGFVFHQQNPHSFHFDWREMNAQ